MEETTPTDEKLAELADKRVCDDCAGMNDLPCFSCYLAGYESPEGAVATEDAVEIEVGEVDDDLDAEIEAEAEALVEEMRKGVDGAGDGPAYGEVGR